MAFKAPGYCSYSARAEARFEEFGRLLDLDAEAEEVLGKAIVATLPLLV